MSIKGLLWVHFFYHGKRRFERDVTDGSLMEMLCAYDLLLCEESLDEAMEKFSEMKESENECW